MSLPVIIIVVANIIFRLSRRGLIDAISGKTTSEEDLNRIDNIVMFGVCAVLAFILADPFGGSELVMGALKFVGFWVGLVVAYATIVVFLRLFQK